MANEPMTFQIDNAQIIFRNFAGKKTDMNREGERNFCIPLDEANAQEMARQGWNVKYLRPREEGDEPTPYIKITVKFTFKPPRVTMISSSGPLDLDESTVSVLDYASIERADLICNAYDWEVGDKSGTSAYLKTLVVVIEEDELEKRWGLNVRT